MFSLAHLTLLELEKTTTMAIALKAARILQETCLSLTQGQHLDMAYEQKGGLAEQDYWPMVKGKTAALLGACTEIGSLAAGAAEAQRAAYRRFGRSLGLSFQVQDDILGIWGNTRRTGKSAESDMVTGKKSLPVLYGLGQNGLFARRWKQGPITTDEVIGLSQELEAEGARAYAQETAASLTAEALQALQEAQPEGDTGQALQELADKLLKRQA